MDVKESFVVKGLGGKKTLNGTVRINGAKNAALKAMAASILFEGAVVLNNVPRTDDIDTMASILTKLGAKVTWTGEHIIEIDTSNLKSTSIDPELASAMRASVVLSGPLLARMGSVSFPSPGGCVIGARPVDLFLESYERMGAKTLEQLTEEYCLYNISGHLSGTEITFKKISVGATETLMMAAVLAEGITVLKNCAQEPEIVNVAEWLNTCGADIKGVGTPTITIVGRNGALLSDIHPYTAIPDRIETGSFLFLGALCAENLTIENCRPDHLDSVISVLKESGVPIETDVNAIRITKNTKANSTFGSMMLETREYPGFPTDLQSPLVVYLSQVNGESRVVENIFEGRFKYVQDLIRLGAHIDVKSSFEVWIHGPRALKSPSPEQDLFAHDIRAGFALVLAALCAAGEFTIHNIRLIDRGYEHLEERLKKIGANIERVSAVPRKNAVVYSEA